LPSGTTSTFADGIATRATYDLTFTTLLDGLAGFVAVHDEQILKAMRVLWTHTHNLAEGAGAAGMAGLLQLGSALEGKTVGVVISGGNCDAATVLKAFG
jgi:threonine dehydratase